MKNRSTRFCATATVSGSSSRSSSIAGQQARETTVQPKKRFSILHFPSHDHVRSGVSATGSAADWSAGRAAASEKAGNTTITSSRAVDWRPSRLITKNKRRSRLIVKLPSDLRFRLLALFHREQKLRREKLLRFPHEGRCVRRTPSPTEMSGKISTNSDR